MILLIAAEKGGVGKSTLATNLAVHLAHQGVDVVLLDTDGQATAARFVERRDEAGITPAVPCVQRTGDVASTLRDLAHRYQVVVVDAGGRDSREMRSAMAVANLLLVPTKASQADLETFSKVNELIGLARGLNPKLKAVVLLSIAPTNPAIREVEDARELLATFDMLELADTIIRDRKVYRDALLMGKGVIELDNGQARAEIQLLAQEFFELN
ncbi:MULTISPECIES: division plane positioning ATPase MipZ [Burkholderia cepacia complex]|uniref:Chromosome-partitioning ATPase Soj n=1 Tax=Burkholderia pseudomultivorans TaxID=1207504 RepID=A0ABU2ECX3_9BURK|nr:MULTISPECIES: division plane positioning ATPase MipZ [Burkholderia cepacia complex]KVD37048.1 cobyrinic acid ac-diamide synthase [Burkholderia ubonensis]KVE63328.1 cobyrinic acid ac-diamide synthase [Burkholderia vietnamiensis]MDR8731918.1 Chromosome-partitioning ATPase Soj [Burkholderia pseudomultivorans]MDR8738907.1 Chromosome-partitioning ATPase Soj [Burkholderia pseudomultivorans]MDR8745652.1 Chromosome-partitioning ATPase Soj [Burkholderia pseudomultivorans]